MKDDSFTSEYPACKNASELQSSPTVEIIIRDKHPVVLDGKKYWTVDLERTYIPKEDVLGFIEI